MRKGAPVDLIDTGDDHLFAFRRMTNGQGVTVAANLSDQPRSLTLPGDTRPVTIAPWDHVLRR